MIAETRFAKSYNSLWRSIAPTMELFIRKANLRLYERAWRELVPIAPPERRALINQTSFRVVSDAAKAVTSLDEKFKFARDDGNIKQAEISIIGSNVVLGAEIEEIREISRRMIYNLYGPHRSEVTLNPKFAGCGIINSCSGDAIENGNRIIELKDGDRAFRSYEFRQLSIYAALFLNETGNIPSSIEVVNSRRGVQVKIDIEDFANEVAGQSAFDFLREVIRITSDITISR